VIDAETTIGERRYVRILLKDRTVRRMGYYRVALQCISTDSIFGEEGALTKELTGETLIVLAPDACYLPPESTACRFWGVTANLYALKSSRNQGIGDFRDLEALTKQVAACGGSFVGINPLHAIPNTYPYGISPYSPITRLYKNYLYLELDAIPDIHESDTCRRLAHSPTYRNAIAGLRSAAAIDYEAVAEWKERMLRPAFSWFMANHWEKADERGSALRDFIKSEGDALDTFATWAALREHLGKDHGWPAEYSTPHSPAIAVFRKRYARQILYHQYLQWLIEEQHQRVAYAARSNGMKIGLYHDIAVGSIASGSDVWAYPDLFARGVSVGAPLDDFNPSGQNWGFPPIMPERLRESGYAFFIETIRRNMRHAGAIRIDHALGLFRLFWIPDGASPLDGAYVRCSTEELLRIIALESVRNETIVIGEDLGTFSDDMRETLQRFRLLSFRLLYFERYYPDPNFRRPEHYPEMAIAAVTTHDLPTLAGFWIGRDIDIKEGLHLFPDPSRIPAYRDERRHDRTLLIRALKERGFLRYDFPEAPDDVPEMTVELTLATYVYLARTPSKMLNVMVDDLMGLVSQQNLPGTVNQHPNWVQKTAWQIEELSERSWLRAFGGCCRDNGR